MSNIEKAIEHFKVGISHDIFKEPVITYAKLAVDALEKQMKQEVKTETSEKELLEYLKNNGQIILQEVSFDYYKGFHDGIQALLKLKKVGE